MIDWKRVEELREEIGADGFVEVADMFLDEAEGAVRALVAGLPAQEIEGQLHFLKGSALTLGLDPLADLCRQCEAGPQVHPSVLQDLYLRSRAAIRQDQIRNSDSTSSLVMSR